jgi:hypothetical protein
VVQRRDDDEHGGDGGKGVGSDDNARREGASTGGAENGASGWIDSRGIRKNEIGQIERAGPRRTAGVGRTGLIQLGGQDETGLGHPKFLLPLSQLKIRFR